MDGDGPREDGVAGGGAPEVVDAELHAGDAAVAQGHVRPHARQALSDQRRHAAVQHLERLPAGHERKHTRLLSVHTQNERARGDRFATR